MTEDAPTALHLWRCRALGFDDWRWVVARDLAEACDLMAAEYRVSVRSIYHVGYRALDGPRVLPPNHADSMDEEGFAAAVRSARSPHEIEVTS